jgi:tetrahydromethanopterin S-methyltransferase subunit C
MRGRLKFLSLSSALIVVFASIAVVYRLIPLQAEALIGVISITVIGAVIARRPTTEPRATAKRSAVGIWKLIWPPLMGAIVAIFGVWSDGWKLGDTIGAIVGFLLLTAYVSVFWKRAGRASRRE